MLLDATAVPVDRGGVGRYVDNLVPALVRAGVDLRVACRPVDTAHYRELSGHEPLAAPHATDRRPVRLAWEQIGLPALVRQAAADVLHSPHYTHPLVARVPSVVTLHDATFFTDARLHAPTKVAFFRAATQLALRRAAQCVVDSRATAEELTCVAGADPSRLTVAHLGVDTAVFAPPSAAQIRAVRDRLGLTGPYVAFLGTLEPRKNVPALIRGWVSAAHGRAEPPALVLAGGRGWDHDVDAALVAVPAPLRVIRAGYLPLELLAGLLGGAEVVAYPSLAEGFGLPVLEAMACGAAVLTTRRTSLPEVGGDAVEYTEPDWASIATALRGLLDDQDRRATLRGAGVARAAAFTWDACAAAHVSAYGKATAMTRDRLGRT